MRFNKIISLGVAAVLVLMNSVVAFADSGQQYSKTENLSCDYEIRKDEIDLYTSDNKLVYQNVVEYPYFLGDTVIEREINSHYQKIISDYKVVDNSTQVGDKTYEDYKGWYAGNPDYFDSSLPYYDNISSKVTYNKNGYLSILECSDMWSGGAHPYQNYNSYIYDLKSGNILYDDSVRGEVSLNINDYINCLSASYEGNGNIPIENNDIKNLTQNDLEAIVLGENDLLLYYNVGAAMPRLIVTIPYDNQGILDLNFNRIKDNITVVLNGNELSFDQPPYIENGTTMVPMRAIFEALGASVDYDAETKTITANKGSTIIELTTGASTAKVNGREKTLASPVANKNGTTMVPLRLVSEALGAEVSWDAESKVVTINLEEKETDKMVFSSNDTSLSFKVGENIIIGVGLNKDNVTDDELNNIKMSLDDRYSVIPYDSKIIDNNKYFYFKANAEGNYSIYAENSKTGERVEIPLSINKNKTYNIGEVPTQKVDNEDVIVNNFSGMTIDNYKEEKLSNGSCNVSFDVYNTKSIYGEVEVYDSNGKLKSAKPIEKASDNATSMKGALLDNLKDLYGDIVEGTTFTYKQKQGNFKKTSVSVNIPKGGYIKITNDVKESFMVGILNVTDLCLQTKNLLSVGGKIDGNMENKVAEKITSEKFLNKISAKVAENPDVFTEKLAEKITEKITFSADGVGDFLSNLTDVINEANIDSIIGDALIESGASVGQDVFTGVAGPAGVGLNAIFKMTEIGNIVLGIRHFETSLDKGAIVIQNK